MKPDTTTTPAHESERHPPEPLVININQAAGTITIPTELGTNVTVTAIFTTADLGAPVRSN